MKREAFHFPPVSGNYIFQFFVQSVQYSTISVDVTPSSFNRVYCYGKKEKKIE